MQESPPVDVVRGLADGIGWGVIDCGLDGDVIGGEGVVVVVVGVVVVFRAALLN